MKTTEITQYRTVCKSSAKFALNLLKENGATVHRMETVSPQYVGKAIIFYDANNKQLANLSIDNRKLLLTVPSFSPIYK